MSKKKQSSISIKSAGIIVCTTIALYVLMTAILTILMQQGKINDPIINPILYSIMFVGMYAGVQIGRKKELGNNTIIIAGATTIVLLVVINLVFYNGTFQNIIPKILSVSLGIILPVVMGKNKKRRSRKRKLHR